MRPFVTNAAKADRETTAKANRKLFHIVTIALLSFVFAGVPPLAYAQEEKAAEKAAIQKARDEAAAKEQASPQPVKPPEEAKTEGEKAEEDKKPSDPMSSGTFNALKLRLIGP